MKSDKSFLLKLLISNAIQIKITLNKKRYFFHCYFIGYKYKEIFERVREEEGGRKS